MKYVWLLIDKTTNDVVAIYNDETIAKTMLPHIELKLHLVLFLDRRSVNQEISMIGVVK